MVKIKKAHNLNHIEFKKKNLKKSKIKNSLKNANLKGGFLGFNKQNSFIDNYISEEKGLISLYFSTSSILKKIKIAKKINKKIIELSI